MHVIRKPLATALLLVALQVGGCNCSGGSGLGDACEESSDCDVGLYCASASETCQKVAADGAADSGSGAADGATGADGAATTTDSGWYSGTCNITMCQGTFLYACGDCEDNDGDGLADSQDPDCLGPCDNNEAGFNTLIPGGNVQPCFQECYFDADNGSGNDDCFWDHRCDPQQPQGSLTCMYQIPCATCDCAGWEATQSMQCGDYCGPLVPNGCDCFGCCELGGVFRFIGTPGCTLDDLSSCDPCTPVPSCLNACEMCEICLGRPELPKECGGEQECPDGYPPCGKPGDPSCEAGTYCITGCCAPIIL